MTALEDVNDVEVAASYIKVSPRVLLSLCQGPAPKIGFLKTGRTYTFTRDDLETYVQTHRTPPATPHPMGLTASSARRVAGVRS